jgi:hypothetical protein
MSPPTALPTVDPLIVNPAHSGKRDSVVEDSSATPRSRGFRDAAPFWRIALLAVATVLVQGYHFAVDDAAIYVPAVQKVVHPALFPFGAEFFLAHGRLSLFAAIVGNSARLLHLPVAAAIFFWHVFSVFFLLLAAWRLVVACFEGPRSRWCAILLLAAVLPVPVAGTALPIMDPYLTARSFSTPITILAVACFVEDRRAVALLWLLLAATIHPQMAVYGFGFLLFLSLPSRWIGLRTPEARAAEAFEPVGVAAFTALPGRLPQGFSLTPPSGTYRSVLRTRTFFYAGQWSGAEWAGVFAPLAILFALTRVPLRGVRPPVRRLCAAAFCFGVLSTIVFFILSATPALESFVRLQPMRSFHLVYILMFLLLGGLAGEYLPRRYLWIVPALLIGTSVGMFAVDRATYPDSPHVEWPWARPSNPWLQAFAWIRDNTPQDAVFALNPDYLAMPGEDHHGFRALAERSMLADRLKDSGAVSLFPQLAPEWEREQRAEQGWNQFTLADFQQLARSYPVRWVVLGRTPPAGMPCPFHNAAVTVCRIPANPDGAGA